MNKRTFSTLLTCALVFTIAYSSSYAAPAPDIASDPKPTPGSTDRSLPNNINDIEKLSKRDRLEKALVRLARGAMKADLTTNEPWLYDRATTYYKLAVWSGDIEFRTHAFELVELYYSQISADGHFQLKPGDPKYAYTDGAVWYEHETGDSRFRPKAEAIYRNWVASFPATYSEQQNFWTERNIAFALGAALGWHELSGDPQALDRARSLVAQWHAMSKESGAPLHSLAQHQEEFEPPWAGRLMTSPWMAALFFEYLQHYERLTGDPVAPKLVSDYADFLLDNCLYDGSRNHPNLSGYLMPYYLCGADGIYYERETPSEGDGEHTPDVMGIMAYAVHSKRKLGLDYRAALQAYEELRRSAAYFVSRRSNVQPPRKINWWIATSYDSEALVRKGKK